MCSGVTVILPYAGWRNLTTLIWRRTHVLAGGMRGDVLGGLPISFGVLGKTIFPIVLFLGRYVFIFEPVVLTYTI